MNVNKHITTDNLDVAPPAQAGPWSITPATPRTTWDVVVARGAVGILAGVVAWYLLPPFVTGTALVIGAAWALKRFVLSDRIGGVEIRTWRNDVRGTDIVNPLGVAAILHANRQFPNVSSYSPSTQQLPAGRGQVIEGQVVEQAAQLPVDPFAAALDALPRLIDLEHVIDTQPGGFAVPLGQDHTGTPIWRDMRKDMLHVGIFGGTGAGKDNLFESWFVALTRQNSPEQVQFAVLDGKGHWTQPALASRAHFWRAPAGGIGQEGQTAMQSLLKAIQAEAARRGRLVFGADCDTLERYMLKTGDRMPYLVVYFSDVMGSLVNEVDRLLVDLVSKARALGIRVVVSLQTPTKQNTQWRSNLSTVICGQLQGRSNDAPALGLAERDILFPPSQLPDPKVRPGVFSVRAGREQLLIQAPLVRRDYMARIVAELPGRPALRAGGSSATMPSAARTLTVMDRYARTAFKNDVERVAWLAWNTDLGTREMRKIVGNNYNDVVRIAGIVRAKKPSKQENRQ